MRATQAAEAAAAKQPLLPQSAASFPLPETPPSLSRSHTPSVTSSGGTSQGQLAKDPLKWDRNKWAKETGTVPKNHPSTAAAEGGSAAATVPKKTYAEVAATGTGSKSGSGGGSTGGGSRGKTGMVNNGYVDDIVPVRPSSFSPATTRWRKSLSETDLTTNRFQSRDDLARMNRLFPNTNTKKANIKRFFYSVGKMMIAGTAFTGISYSADAIVKACSSSSEEESSNFSLEQMVGNLTRSILLENNNMTKEVTGSVTQVTERFTHEIVQMRKDMATKEEIASFFTLMMEEIEAKLKAEKERVDRKNKKESEVVIRTRPPTDTWYPDRLVSAKQELEFPPPSYSFSLSSYEVVLILLWVAFVLGASLAISFCCWGKKGVRGGCCCRRNTAA